MSLDKLVYMANQIGKFFASQGHEQAAAGTADHIKKFWDPRMRAAIFAHLKEGGGGTRPGGPRGDRKPRGKAEAGTKGQDAQTIKCMRTAKKRAGRRRG